MSITGHTAGNRPSDSSEAVDAIVARIGRTADKAIAILQAIQETYNYLPEPALRRVAALTDITPAAITGIMSFYAQFRTRPAGRHFIRVCIGTACHVKGSKNITDAFRRRLAIGEGSDTDSDGLFTVEEVACLGCCMLAPAVQIDDVIYGHVEPRNVDTILADFLAAQASGSPGPRSGAGTAGDAEVRLCRCSSCRASGSDEVFKALGETIDRLALPAVMKTVGCTGISYQTPLVEIADPSGEVFRYGRVRTEDAAAILQRHVQPAGMRYRLRSAADRLLARMLRPGSRVPVTRYSIDIRNGPDADYVQAQTCIATEASGQLDPLDPEDYRRHGGFTALEKALAMAPEAIIRTVQDAGLRGRGGAGFPTGAKWAAVQAAEGDVKYLICNGDEGDPGAFMDRMLLESFPFRVLEGIIIASRAVAAAEGFLYIRAEYPLAVIRVTEALRILETLGMLGERIMGSSHSFKLHVVQGAGAFVCGEETALIAAVEGRRGMPGYRPPYPASRGLRGRPTLVNNVETFALVPWIFRQGAGAFSALGTARSNGTKAFALAGKVLRGGLIEVPMGMTIRQVVAQIGGGIPDGRQFKAVQIGGPSGGCVPASLADTPIDYEALTEAGAIMGSGGLVVLDDTDCMVDIARYFLAFTQRESCGKCTFCRIGTKRMLEILERITQGQGKADDIARLEELAGRVRQGSLCGLGRTAPNPVLSTLRHFREEYEAHIAGRCPAGKCKALITYTINDKCIGCTRCAQNCPAEAIVLRPYEQHVIDAAKCIRCDTCRQVCPAQAVEVT